MRSLKADDPHHRSTDVAEAQSDQNADTPGRSRPVRTRDECHQSVPNRWTFGQDAQSSLSAMHTLAKAPCRGPRDGCQTEAGFPSVVTAVGPANPSAGPTRSSMFIGSHGMRVHGA